MKKTIIICSSFTVFSFVVCMIYAMIAIPVPDFVLASSRGIYRFLNSMRFFLRMMPVIVATGYTIGLSVEFGSDQDGSLVKFSSAMFVRYRKIMIFSLVCTCIFTFGNLIFIPLINNKLESYREIPGLIREYQNLSEKLYNSGEYELAFIYGKKAVEIDPINKKSYELMINAELEETKRQNEQKPIVSEKSQSSQNRKIQQRLTASKPYEVFELLSVAKKCVEAEDWFGAHFNSTQALNIASDCDINVGELKQIAALSWNKLTTPDSDKLTDEQKIFAKKLEGYSALVSGDNLRAYYIFKTLSLASRELSIDPDVVTYLAKSEELVKNACFFIDETYNLVGFETYNNVYFSVSNKSGSKFIVFIKGITPVATDSEIVQYLRGLTVFEIDRNQNVKSGYYVPYAKMLSISTEFFDDNSRILLGIENFDYVPYIMLKSIDRKTEGIVSVPQKIENLPLCETDGFQILPMDYNDFELIQIASNGAEDMEITSLFPFVGKAEKYGYSSIVYAQSLFDRLLYPFSCLSVMILLAVFAWNARLKEGQTFKFKWIVMFPFLCAVFYIIYRIALILFKFFNFAMLGLGGYRLGLLLALLLNLLCLVIFSVLFLSQRNTEG